MKKKISSILSIIVVMFLFIDSKKVMASDDNTKVFSFEKDGYLKPSDMVSHDFYISNNYNVKCYLKSISFENILVKDIQSSQVYSLNDAKNMNILSAYSVSLKLEDNSVLFFGKLEDLYVEGITLSEPMFLDINEKITFNMTIFMDNTSGNDYQNKYYEFTMHPEGYKVIYDNNSNDFQYEEDSFIGNINKKFETGDKNIVIIMYEIMFLFFLFLIVYRLRINKIHL